MKEKRIFTAKEKIILIFALFTGILHIAKFTFLNMESIKFYIFHLMLGLCFVYAYRPVFKEDKSFKYILANYIPIIASLACGLYLILSYDKFIVYMQTGMFTSGLYILSFVLLILIVEACRRTIGLALPIIAMITILYALFGNNLPGLLAHKGYSISRILNTLLSDQGFYGTPIAVSANTVFLFLLFGAFLKVSDADKIFQDLAIIITGKMRGGPAKMSVVASALFGSISGSAVANVVSTGAFTIPLMKKTGYTKRFSGAVEAVASTGGQIMPPIMGAAAFVLADISRTPYSVVCTAALLPALMYYTTIFKIVDLEAVKHNLKSFPEDQIPAFNKVIKKSFKLLIPLFVLLYLLLIAQISAMRAAIFSIVTIIVCALFDREDRFNLEKLFDGFLGATKSLPQVVSACACSGIVTGMFALTGLGLKFSDFVVTLAGTNILLSLLLSMVVCIILGMGLPTTASYIIGATAIAPALIKIGIAPLSAHLFILYFASISAITPPVSVASYAAASISDENAIKVGLTAVKLGVAGFVLPFVFTLNMDYLHFKFDFLTLLTWISAFVVCNSVAIAMMGYIDDKITIFERVLFLIIVICAIQSSYVYSLAGIILYIAETSFRKFKYKRVL